MNAVSSFFLANFNAIIPFLNKKLGGNEILSLKKVIFLLIHPENSAMIGKVALFLDVYPEYM